MRWRYVCRECGNDIPAGVVEKRVAGSRGQVRTVAPAFCESAAHPSPVAMEREGYMPERREVGRMEG